MIAPLHASKWYKFFSIAYDENEYKIFFISFVKIYSRGAIPLKVFIYIFSVQTLK